MTEQEKKKTVNVEDMQAFGKVIHNKVIGSEGTCTTAAATAAKEVTVGTTFSPVAGATLLVTFQNAITVASPILAVTYGPSGSTATLAAKPIYYRGEALGANMVKAGVTLLLRYDGTRFNIIGDLDTDTNTMTDVAYDTTNKKLQKTVAGVTSDVVTAANIVKDGNAMLIAGYKWTGGSSQLKKDLNTLTGVGVYADFSALVTNKPTDSSSSMFRLIVEKPANSEGSLRQVYQGYDERNVYERSSIDGQTWSAWELVQANLSNYASASSLSNYLPLAGGTMANTNLVTNLNADQLDGLHASDFSRVHTYSIAIGKVAKITFGGNYSAIVTGSYADSGNQRIMLMGVGYGTPATASRNRWLCLDCSSVYSWAKSPTVGRTIEIKNGSSRATCKLTVLEMNGADVTFTELDDFSQDASVITDKVAMLSSDITGNAATATALKISRTIWGQSFDGTADVSGAISGATTIDATGNITINRNATTTTYAEVKNTLGSIRLEVGSSTAANRGVYDSDTSAWLIHTSRAGNTFLPIGNVGIGTTSPTSKLHVDGDAKVTGIMTSDRQRVGLYSGSITGTSMTIRSDRSGTQVYTLSKNISSVAINSTYNDFVAGERIMWILTATAQRTVAIASSETIVLPSGGSSLTLTVPANGFVTVMFIYDGSKFFVRPLDDHTVMMQQTT